MPGQIIIAPPAVHPLPVGHIPCPGAILAAVAVLQQVLGQLALRHPASLSAAEADLQAFFAGGEEDLESIRDRAENELGTATVISLRRGE